MQIDAGATRNLAAVVIEKTRDVVCYGIEQGEDARYPSKQVYRDAQVCAFFLCDTPSYSHHRPRPMTTPTKLNKWLVKLLVLLKSTVKLLR